MAMAGRGDIRETSKALAHAAREPDAARSDKGGVSRVESEVGVGWVSRFRDLKDEIHLPRLP